MKIGIILYAFQLVAPLEAIIGHILTGTGAHLYLFLHSQNAQVMAICNSWTHPFAFQWQSRVHYFPYGVNRGLARSANEGFMQGYLRDGMDVMMTCNDDLLPAPGDIEKIAMTAYDNRDKWMINGRATVGGRENEDSHTSLAAINPIAFDTIGYFDTNFFPAYFEDLDYERRARLAGLERLTVADTHIVHQGSASLPHVPKAQHDEQFSRNRDYYIRKWGGEPGHEVYARPFNDPAVGLNIIGRKVLYPYTGHNRDDYADFMEAQ